MIHIYTGDGKGKTTAATGLAVRAMGAGLHVFFAQFIKNGSSSEIRFLREHGGNAFTYYTRGSGKFILQTPSEDDCNRARETLDALILAVACGEYCVVVADEILGSLHANLLSYADVMKLIEISEAHPDIELILTGRNAPDELIAHAGLVSEIKCIKHYFTQNRPPKKGIEF